MANTEDLERIFNAASQIAVATLTEDGTAPDVRIVLGVYDKATNQELFMTAANAEKVAEIGKHSQASFATPQFGNNDVARVRKATVQKIDPTPEQLALYNAKYPQTAKYAAHADFFALRFEQAEVTIGGENSTVEVSD